MSEDRPRRKAIPDKIKLQVVLRQGGLCKHCGHKLEGLETVNFDHRPAIINRDVNEDRTDYLPAQLDPEYIEAIHISPCHDVRTNGPGGEKRITTAGSDKHTRDKNRRLAQEHQNFRALTQAKHASIHEGDFEPAIDEPPRRRAGKPKTKWPKRSFPPAQRKGRASNYRRKGV